MLSKKTLAVLKKHQDRLPHPLRILLRNAQPVESHQVSAVCLQYPVQAQDDAAEGAVAKLLENLAAYLEHCAAVASNPWCYAAPLYMHAFEFGNPLNVASVFGNLEVRSSTDFTQFLETLVEIKEEAGEESPAAMAHA